MKSPDITWGAITEGGEIVSEGESKLGEISAVVGLIAKREGGDSPLTVLRIPDGTKPSIFRRRSVDLQGKQTGEIQSSLFLGWVDKDEGNEFWLRVLNTGTVLVNVDSGGPKEGEDG